MESEAVVSSNGFEQMLLPQQPIPALEISRYRIYSTKSEFVEVEAQSAMDAMRAANIMEPVRVVRELPLYQTLLSRNWLGIGATDAPPAQEMAPTQASGEQATLQ